MKFTKMHGIGNDYVYVNAFEETVADAPATAITVSDRHFGIGSDGLILICPDDKADARMEMYNADGSRAQMCGNGIRCVAKYVYDHGIAKKETLDIASDDGIKTINLTIENGKATKAQVNMGNPRRQAKDIPFAGTEGEAVAFPITAGDKTFACTMVSMGNPHCVIFVDNTETFPVDTYGPLLENHELFPERTNVEFVQVVSDTELIQRTWERGSAETMACGTGACAVAVAAVLNGKAKDEVLIHLLGGDLEIKWDRDNDVVFMTGPGEEVFTGEIAV